MNLSITDYKNTAEMLGRFANIREGAPEPTDRILIQFDGVAKFVAGDAESTVIVNTGMPVETNGKALVSARLFLQAAKTLRGKGDVGIELDGKGGALLRTNTGGKVVLPRISDALPGWVRPSVESATAMVIEIPDSFWPDLSKLIGVGPHKQYGWQAMAHFEIHNGELRVLWSDSYRVVEHTFPSASFTTFKYVGSVSVEFLKSLKAFEGVTSMVLYEDRIAVHSGESSAVSRLTNLMHNGKRLYELPPYQQTNGPVVGATVNRKDFIDNLKAVSSADEHNRVTVMVGPGEVKVYGYGLEREGSMTMKTSSTQGRGYISFKEELATKLLSGLRDKELSFYFPERGTGPIRFKETKWGLRLYLAPIAL